MTIQTLIKGMLPVCQKCREVNGEEPDKCGKREWCKSIFAAGVAHEREECAQIAQQEEEAHNKLALEADGGPWRRHHTIAAATASVVKQVIRARGKA